MELKVKTTDLEPVKTFVSNIVDTLKDAETNEIDLEDFYTLIKSHVSTFADKLKELAESNDFAH